MRLFGRFSNTVYGDSPKSGAPPKMRAIRVSAVRLSALRNVTAFIDVAATFYPYILKHHIKPTSSLLKKNMDLDFENFNFEVVNLNTVVEFKRDFNLNEVNDHSDLSDIEVNPETEPYFDYESSMPIEDMMTALENNIIFSNNEPTPDNDNSFVNLANLDNVCKTIENTGKLIKNSKKNLVLFKLIFFSL